MVLRSATGSMKHLGQGEGSSEPEAASLGKIADKSLSRTEAAVVGWAPALLVSSAFLVARADLPATERFSLHLFDLGQYLAFAYFSYLACALWKWRGPPGLGWSLLALALLMNGLGWLTLPPDLANFSERQADVLHPDLVLVLGITLVATAPVAAWLLGHVCARPLLRSIAIAVSAAVHVGNQLLLPGDYKAIHLFVALCAALLAGAALRGAQLPWLKRPRRISLGASWIPQLLVAAIAMTFVVLSPPPRARIVWEQQGLPLLRVALAPIRASLFSRVPGMSPLIADEWWADRARSPSIPPTRSVELPQAPVVIIISIDALRADLIEGDYDADLPNLARIRDEAIWFRNVYAPGTLTKVSIASTFMGKYFSQQYWSKDDRGLLLPAADETQRFPELLRKAGVRTVNYRTINWLRSPNGHVRGFQEERYVKYPRKKNYYTPSKPLMAEFLPRILRTTEAPHLFFTHLSDAHAPYTLGKKKGTEFERYLSEVQLVDDHLAQVLQTLRESGLEKRAILVITSDHGEAFGEHGSRTHGTTLYEEELRVPLLIRMPKRQGRTVAQLTTLLDIGPTVLDLFHQETPGYFMGQSLVPFLIGRSPTLTRPVAAEARLKQAMIFPDGMKLIYDTRTDSSELYDLRRDPNERHDISDDREKLSKYLEAHKAFFAIHTLRRNGYKPPFIR